MHKQIDMQPSKPVSERKSERQIKTTTLEKRNVRINRYVVIKYKTSLL